MWGVRVPHLFGKVLHGFKQQSNESLKRVQVLARWLAAMAGVAAGLPSGCSVAQWKASLFPHEPDSAASHGWNWRKCALPSCHPCVGACKRWLTYEGHRPVPADNMHNLGCLLVRAED